MTIEVGLLHFTYDTLFICEENTSNIIVIKSILRIFELAYGLRTNFFKSKIGGMGIKIEVVDHSLGC